MVRLPPTRRPTPRSHVCRLATCPAVAALYDLWLPQWLRLYERALAAEPDLLVEVGRGYGNSTVVLVEAAHELDAGVVSVGFDEPPAFEGITWPKLAPVVSEAWRAPLTVIQADVRDYTPPACERGFLFWDAHGPEVADEMLDRLIPGLPRGSTVIVHDVNTPHEAAVRPLEIGYPYSWRGFVSPFDELPLLGGWLEMNGIQPEQDTGMLAFTV
jgi:hypothetical protein